MDQTSSQIWLLVFFKKIVMVTFSLNRNGYLHQYILTFSIHCKYTEIVWTGKQCYKDLLCSETYWDNWPALQLQSVSFLLLQLDREDSASLVASIKLRDENVNKDGDNDQDCIVHKTAFCRPKKDDDDEYDDDGVLWIAF